MEQQDFDVIVVGSGAAGLSAAIALAPRRVAVVTKTDGPKGGSTPYGQGGIAAAIGPGDSPAFHAADTLRAGAGAGDEQAVALLAEQAPGAIAWLEAHSMPFDRDSAGAIALGREAAHGRRRVLHAGGDATGAALSASLASEAQASDHIALFTQTFAAAILTDAKGGAQGVLAHAPSRGWHRLAAPHVILATGGAGQAYAYTTNPPESTGDGFALASRTGAPLADMELVQFHPTALAIESAAQLPLLTEALRGEGALLVDVDGHSIMTGVHPDAELAPRDVVAREVWRRRAIGDAIYLDARAVPDLAGRFPTVSALASQYGFDPAADLLPVAPAAHYMMGGVATDLDGATAIAGLWAVGEVARTGVHGANRLASNSMLECVVFARRAAAAILAMNIAHRPPMQGAAPTPSPIGDAGALPIAALRRVMYRDVGLARNAAGLTRAIGFIDDCLHKARHAAPLPAPNHAQIRAWCEAVNLIELAGEIARAALAAPRSLGAHYRTDEVEAGKSA